ncbi:MAG TPA: peptidylprolyl isomerase [Actinopolymorphaceae bacterium]|nr:peptidylprolyl isomerase [Actinopolymorphaceae bacterium]
MVTKKQRQRQLARDKWQRQQTRRVTRRQRARRRGVVAAAVVGVLAVGAGGYGVSLLFRGHDAANAAPSPSATTTPSPTPSATPVAAPRPTKAGECTYVTQPGDDQLSVGIPAATAPTKDAHATIKTDHGTITADLLGTKASCAVNSFTYLAGKNAYDKTACTGLGISPAPARYLECGDLTGSGGSGPGYVFGNENDGKSSIGAGWLVMADGENRNGSRFYITYGDSSTFDHPMTVFGKVTKGLDVVAKVARAGLAPNSGSKGVGRPATSVIIEDVKVTTK